MTVTVTGVTKYASIIYNIILCSFIYIYKGKNKWDNEKTAKFTFLNFNSIIYTH